MSKYFIVEKKHNKKKTERLSIARRRPNVKRKALWKMYFIEASKTVIRGAIGAQRKN